MLFHKTQKKSADDFPFPGVRETIDGLTALEKTAELAKVKLEKNTASASGNSGFSLTGYRQSAIIRGKDSAVLRSLQLSAKFHAPDVYFMLLGDLDAANQLPGDDCFHLFAKDVQEAVDFSLIARRIAELTLTPGICALDEQFTAHALQTVNMPETKLVRKFLGDAGDEIDTPTAAQKIIFGEKRRRVPRWLDIDRPLSLGATFNAERLKHIAAQNAFFEQHIAEFSAQAFREFGELTGRFYQPAQGYLADDAQYLIVTQGSITDDLISLANYLRQTEKIKIGVVNINMFRPFPGGIVSHLVKGKKGLTVLENANTHFSDDPPLFREIQACLAKAAENGQSRKDALPYPDFAVFQKNTDRPALFSGIFSLNEKKPLFGELYAMITNMLPGNAGKKRFFLGVNFESHQLRYPLLQTQQQKIQNAYPKLSESGLSSEDWTKAIIRKSAKAAQSIESRKIEIYDIDEENCNEAGRLLTKLFVRTTTTLRVSAFPEAIRTQNRKSFVLNVWENDTPAPQFAAQTDSLLVTHPSLLKNVAILQNNGLIILESSASPAAIWENFSEQLRRQVRDKKLRIFTIDAQRIAREHRSIPAFENKLSLHALMGGFIGNDPHFAKNEKQIVLNNYRRLLEETFSESVELQNEFFKALQAGMAGAVEMPWQEFPSFQEVPPPELAAPHAVQQVSDLDDSVFDLARFWDSVGYFYATHQPELTLTDPHLATATMPSNSGVFRDLTNFRSEIPQIIPENCTGCGLCSLQCPEVALPAAITDLATLIKTAIVHCQQTGQNLIQMQRIAGQFAKLATRIFANDDLHQHRTLGSLLLATFDQLVEKMGVTGDQYTALQKEFQALHHTVQQFPIVKTNTFFDTPNRISRGSGQIFTITVNPMSCTGCNECLHVCPENALESVGQTTDIVEDYRHNWQFLMELPETPLSALETFISEKRPETLAYQLFNKKVYHSMTGGDSTYPGSGAKTGVHLMLSSLEALYQPRIGAFVQKLDGLIKKLEAKIQGRLEAAVHINDFDEFSQRLTTLNPDELSLANLTKTAQTDAPKQKLDGKQLAQLNAILNKVKSIRDAYVTGANGNGRSQATLLLSGENISVWGTSYPFSPFPYPSINVGGGEIAGLAEGIFKGVLTKMAETFAVIRQAENVLGDTKQLDTDKQKCWQDFSEEERALCPPVLVICEENAHIEKLSRLLSDSLPFKIAILNNTAGLQAGQATLFTEIGLWALMQQRCFVLQSSPGKPAHFLKGLRDGMAFEGPSLFHIYTSEPRQHGLYDWQAVQQEKLAIESRAFPIFRFDPRIPGSFSERLLLDGNPDFENDWMCQEQEKQLLSDSHSDNDSHLTIAHWAVNEGRFSRDFYPLTKGEWQEKHTPLAQYLQMTTEERSGREPIITLVNPKNQPVRIVVSKRFAKAAEKKLAIWRFLQDLAGTRAAVNRQIVEKIRADAREVFEKQKQSVQADFEEKLAQLDQNHWQIYHQRLTQKFLTLCGIGADEQLFKKPLSDYLSKNK